MRANCRIFAVATMIMALALFSAAPGAGAAERIAVLVSTSGPPFEETLTGFQEYLKKQDIVAEYELYRLEDDTARAEQAVQKIKKSGARLIFTLGSFGAKAVTQKIHDIPVVACLVLRPDALAGAQNATGVGLEFPLETQFSWLKTVLPQAKTVGVIYSPPENKKRVEEAARIARKMGLRLKALEISSPQEIPFALATLSKQADVVWGLADRLTLSPQMAKHLLLFAFRNKIPFIGPSDAWVRAGAFYALEWDYRDLGSQCGEIAHRILGGKSPQLIPFSTPRKVLYSLNLKTAQQFRIPVSEQIVKKARNVY